MNAQEIIFDESLFEKSIEEIRIRALSLNEKKSLEIPFHDKYPKHVFEPLEEFLKESFLKGILKRGQDFAKNFVSKSKEIATRISSSIKEFSFKKVFATVTKMMHKIKVKMLNKLLSIFEPLRETIIVNNFCDENNRFSVSETFNKLIEIAKSVGGKEVLSEPVVAAIKKNANLAGTEAIREDREVASFTEEDLQYLGFFQKMMYKLGVKDAKLNGFFAVVSKKLAQGGAVAGTLAVISALLPSAGILSSIAAAAGAAVAAAPLLVTIVGAILFGIGLFMFATWLLKPYPTVKNCEIFLATIFSGSNPFNFPETSLGELSDNLVSQDSVQPPFNNEIIQQLSTEDLDSEVPSEEDEEEKVNLVKAYDEFDVEALEKEEDVNANSLLVRFYVRNIFTENGRDLIAARLRDEKEDNEDNTYIDQLEDLLDLVERCFYINRSELTPDGKKIFPFGLNSNKVQDFLRDKNNSPKKRLEKLIDSVDNFIDKIDNSIKNKALA